MGFGMTSLRTLVPILARTHPAFRSPARPRDEAGISDREAMERRLSELQEKVEELEARAVAEILAGDEKRTTSPRGEVRVVEGTTFGPVRRQERGDPAGDPWNSLREDIRTFVETVEVAQSDLSSRLERMKFELALPAAGPEAAEFAARWEKFLADMTSVTNALAEAASSLEAERSASAKGASAGTPSEEIDAGVTPETERA
jgi:hypothetical protein